MSVKIVQGANFLTSFNVPQLNPLVGTAASENFAIGAKSDRSNFARMSPKAIYFFTSLNIPQLDTLKTAAG